MKKSVFMEELKKTVHSEELSDGREYLKDRHPVYLCLPFEGDMDEYIDKVCRVYPVGEEKKCALIAPYLALMAFKGCRRKEMLPYAQDSVELALNGCDEFWVTRDILTENVLNEIALAVNRGMKIIYIDLMGEEDEDE